MANNSIERRIAYDISGGAKTNLFKSPIKLSANTSQFSLQFFFSSILGGGPGRITLQASNDDTNFFDVPFTLDMVAASPGGWILVGTASGIPSVGSINARFAPGAGGTGTIDKVIFNATGS